METLLEELKRLRPENKALKDRIKELESWMDRELNSGKTSDLYYGIHRKEGKELLTQG
jgi:hypothetical protein